ncbi:MAG TPA: flagellin [Patescibacteria group bacterium]|nr:flagellin [Patescibacteria group bacterium]
MGMVINTNLPSLNTYNKLNANNNLLNKSLEKLSSGYQINSASDDAAGLSISEKMRGQIRGLNQASQNAQDGISMADTAEGALNETSSILQRMRELAVQSASDTNTDDDREAIQAEMDALTTEIDRIAYTTQFNTKNLLDGSMSKKYTATATVEANNALTAGTAMATVALTTTFTALASVDGNLLDITAGSTVKINFIMNGTTYTATMTTSSAGGTALSAISAATVGSAGSTATVADYLTLAIGTAGTTAGALTATAVSAGTTAAIYALTFTVSDADGNENTVASNTLSSFTQTTQARDNNNGHTATILIGANTGQEITINIDNMDAGSLGVEGLQVDTQVSANVAITAIDNAINTVSSERSKLGAVSNRLDYTINNLTTTSENLTAAESRIRDVDMASEMATYTKYSVLNQAATSMLAQANQLPQQVLSLLK